jgi:preprotein translocase subunit SecG
MGWVHFAYSIIISLFLFIHTYRGEAKTGIFEGRRGRRRGAHEERREKKRFMSKFTRTLHISFLLTMLTVLISHGPPPPSRVVSFDYANCINKQDAKNGLPR